MPSKPELNNRLAEAGGTGLGEGLGDGLGEGDGAGVTVAAIEFRSKYCWSATIFSRCRPAARGTPVLPTHWKVFQLPVLGTLTVPVTSWPSTSMWKALVESALLALSAMSYWALAPTLMV